MKEDNKTYPDNSGKPHSAISLNMASFLSMMGAMLTKYRGMVIVLFVLPGGYVFDLVLALLAWGLSLLGKGFNGHIEKVPPTTTLPHLSHARSHSRPTHALPTCDDSAMLAGVRYSLCW
jgi:hypothetical protein